MGMFTELVLAAELKETLPEEVKDILMQMTSQSNCEPTALPAHKFFKTRKWRNLLVADSHYFAGRAHSLLTCDDFSKVYSLSIRCNLKNYDNEIELFLDWLSPYIETSGFLGYIMLEGSTDPELIYFKNNELMIRAI